MSTLEAGLVRFLRVLVIFLLLASTGTCDRRKGFRQHLEKFFCSVDQDGDGEIEQHEATKFLSSIDAELDLAEELQDDSSGGNDVVHDFKFKGDFSYGGATISVEEMLDHLQNMLTADCVVDWITHGLQLPQYAQAFRENAVNGLDFPALIEDQSQTLLYDLQVQSLLHRKKITHAIVRQVFGFGAVPGPPENPQCASARCGAIQLQWDSPSFWGYPPLHKYLIQKRADNASSWMATGDVKENSFVDNDGVHPEKYYTYRIQAWGNHGPSEWVQIDHCHSSDTFASNEHCDLESVKPLVGIEAFVQDDRRISNSDSNGPKAVSQRSAGWLWMYSVNGFLLVLGIISRHSLFFRIILAAWFLFREKVLGTIHTRLVQAQNSACLLERIIGQTFFTAFSFWQFMQAKIWDLSRQVNGVYPRRELIEIESYNDTNEFSGTDPSFESRIGAFCYEDALASKVLAGKQGSLSNLDRMQHDDGQYFTSSDARSNDFKMSSCSAPVESINICSEPLPETMHASDCMKGALCTMRCRNRFRCNSDGCKARFDRWHCLSDWQMKFTKHYCRECQGVFCINHTRISPHGPLGRCGLESNCVCQSCFEGLPIETQQKLEQRNKLRVGPYVSGDSLSYEKKRRSYAILKNTSTDTKINKFDLPRKHDLPEAENESLSCQKNRKDAYPPNLDLAYCSD